MILSSKSNTVIVIPECATERELFAAEELSKYLGKIFSFDAKIVRYSEAPAENVIIIGGPERNKAAAKYISEADFRSEVPGPEGLYIKSLGEGVIILAGSTWHPNECERGTLYAVYEFLERYLGVSFGAFSAPDVNAGETVPKLDCAKLDDISYIKPKADRPYRTAIVQFADAANNADTFENELNLPFIDWLVKNRYNRILTWSSIYEAFKTNGFIKEYERRGLRFTVGHHESSRLFLPSYGNEYFSEHYYETHPEYYKLLDDGTRFDNKNHWGQWIFCSRNKGAVDEVAKNVTEWVYKNPMVDIIAFWPNDGTFDQCKCENCSRYTKTENYCYFINEVAKRVKKTHPNIKFDMLIYTDLWECPEGLKLDSSVLIDESTWHVSGLRSVGRPDGSCLIGTFYQENMKKWRATGADVVYYDYHMGVYGHRQRIIPMADELQALWKSFVDEDFAGSGTQIECFNHWNNVFNFYGFARTGYDTSLSMNDCLIRFSRIFGKGGEEICAAITKLEAALDGQVDIMKCGHYLMEHINKDEIYAHFERALALAEDARERNNIRLMRMAYRYTDLETQDPVSHDEKYVQIMETYKDETGELGKMTEFNSFITKQIGCAISIPLKSPNKGIYPNGDKWYEFE